MVCLQQPLSLNELELLHAGLGVLIAHYLESRELQVARCIALRISRQLRLISENNNLPDRNLKLLYRTMAARWHVRAYGDYPS